MIESGPSSITVAGMSDLEIDDANFTGSFLKFRGSNSNMKDPALIEECLWFVEQALKLLQRNSAARGY